MRIGILTHNYPSNLHDRKDAGIFVYDFAQELSKRADVFVLAPNFTGAKENNKRVPVTWFKWSGGSKKLGNLNKYKPPDILQFIDLIRKGNGAVMDFVKSNKLDFLLACWALPAGVFARKANKQLGIPYATWSLGSDINEYAKAPILKQLIIGSLKHANIRFSNSVLLARKVAKLSGKECEFLPAISQFSPDTSESTMLNKNTFNFLYVGRLEKIKGPDILIKACELLRLKQKNFKVYVIGSGTMENVLKDIVCSSSLSGHVEFLGQQGASKIAGYMLAADCLVIPSRNESLPLVLIEAARCNLPIIATNVGDCKRLVKKYNIGYISRKDNPKNLSVVMEKALKKGKRFKKVYKKSLEELSSDFVISKVAESLIKKIEKIV